MKIHLSGFIYFTRLESNLSIFGSLLILCMKSNDMFFFNALMSTKVSHVSTPSIKNTFSAMINGLSAIAAWAVTSSPLTLLCGQWWAGVGCRELGQ